MTPADELLSHATKFTFYPKGAPGLNPRDDIYLFGISVEWRGSDMWAVTQMSSCFRKDGHKTYEPLPSSRTERFIKAYRFSRDEAVRIATKFVDRQTINGRTYAQWQQFHQRSAS